MGDGLACNRTDIHADVVSVGSEVLDDYLFAFFYKVDQRELLILRQREEVGSMPEWHDEEVTFADGIPVPAGIAESVLCDHIICERFAERALCRLLHN